MEVAASASRAGATSSARRSAATAPIYLLHLPVGDLIGVVRAEMARTGGAPEFYVDAYKDFMIEEDYDRSAYPLPDGNQYDLVTSEAVLQIEPRLEQNYWLLSVIVHKELGPQYAGNESAFLGGPLTLDAFEADFLAHRDAVVSVRLETDSKLAKAHFDQWWASLTARPADPADVASAALVGPPDRGEPNQGDVPMAADPPAAGAWSYPAREAVAVFADADALEAAVTELEMSGFDRAAISVLGSDKAVREHIGRLYRSVAEIEDDPHAPQSGFVSRGSRLQGEASAVTFPFFIGGLAGAVAVVASGGALAAAIAATILGSATGAGLGGLLARAIATHHAQRVKAQIEQGGLVLWVSVADAEAEQRATAILRRTGGQDVHVHQVERQWGPQARPLSDAQMDPLLLERDPPDP